MRRRSTGHPCGSLRLGVALAWLAIAAVVPRIGLSSGTGLTVLGPEEGPRTMLHRAPQAQVGERLEARRKEVAVLKSPEAVQKRQLELLAQFLAALGDFPVETPRTRRLRGQRPPILEARQLPRPRRSDGP